MRHAEIWDRLRSFARGQRGSAPIALALFAIALTACATMVVLGATGVLEVPRLVYLVFAVLTVFAGWDVVRERRRVRGRGKP